MDLVTLTVVSCIFSLVCMGGLGVGVFALVTRGSSQIMPRIAGMLGFGDGEQSPATVNAQSERRRRKNRPSRNLRQRAQSLSFEDAVQRQGGTVPQQQAQPMNAQSRGNWPNNPNQQQGAQNQRRQNRSLNDTDLQPSRPALSPSRRYQSGGGSQNQQNTGRNQQQQQQQNQNQRRSQGRPDFQPPQSPPPGNWGDTLSGQRASQSQQPSQQQNQQSQQQNRPALRGGQRWQGGSPSSSGQQQNQNQQNQQNQKQQNQQGGLGDYRPPLRPRPTAEGGSSDSGFRKNTGRDSRHGDDYDRIYIDGGEW
jgi:hypothetical protein